MSRRAAKALPGLLALIILLGGLYPIMGPGLRNLDGSPCSEAHGSGPEADLNPAFLVLLLPSLLFRAALRRRPVHFVETCTYLLASSPFLFFVLAPECGSLSAALFRDCDPIMFALIFLWLGCGLLLVVSWIREDR